MSGVNGSVISLLCNFMCSKKKVEKEESVDLSINRINCDNSHRKFKCHSNATNHFHFPGPFLQAANIVSYPHARFPHAQFPAQHQIIQRNGTNVVEKLLENLIDENVIEAENFELLVQLVQLIDQRSWLIENTRYTFACFENRNFNFQSKKLLLNAGHGIQCVPFCLPRAISS